MTRPPSVRPVTVVIPAYNRAGMIERALRSVTRQRPAPPAEVIVVDDASSDDTVAVATALGVRVIRHEHNGGAATARNTGIAAATQPWIALLDSDDEWLPHHLETLWGLRDDHVLVAASALGRPDRIVPRGVRPIVHGTHGWRPRVLRSPGDIVSPQPISASAAMVRTDVVRAVGGFDTTRRFGEDWDLWLRVMERGTAVVTPQVGAVVHLHAGGKHLQGDSTSDGWRETLYAYADRPWFSRRAVRRWESIEHWDQMRGELREGRRDAALTHLWTLCNPASVAVLARNVVRRAAARRRVTQVSTDGRPTLARLPGSGPPTTAQRHDREVVDLSALGVRQALLQLARRPTSEALVASARQARLVAALNVTPVGDRS